MSKNQTLKFNFYYKLAIFLLVFGIFVDSAYPRAAVALNAVINNKIEQNIALPISGARSPRKVVNTVVTVYSSTPDQTDNTPFIAANGGRVHDGMLAANWLPFGAQVKFPELFGDKIFIVGDRMNEKYGYGRVDIWMDAPRQELMRFGVKRLKMEIY